MEASSACPIRKLEVFSEYGVRRLSRLEYVSVR